MTANIRFEEPRDREGIRAVHTASFPTPGEARLVDALREAGRLTVSLVAEADGRVVGHVAFSPVALRGAADVSGIGLAPVAVMPEFRRQGIADALIRRGLASSAELGFGVVVVLGGDAASGQGSRRCRR
jgi:putative acetyltransferase